MKFVFYSLLGLGLCLISCSQMSDPSSEEALSFTTNADGETIVYSEDSELPEETSQEAQQKGKTLVMTPLRNTQTGELMGHMPIPKDWKLVNGQVEGPNGIKSYTYPNQMFMFEQRMPMEPLDVIRQDLAPYIYEDGGKILGTFRIPELENYDRAYSDLLWKFGNPQNEFHVVAAEVEEPDGKKALLIVREMISMSPYGSTWMYYISAIESNASAFEETKSDYIFALSHVQPNMEQIQRYNQNEIAKSNASWAAHSQRMAANQAAFNARNQAWMDASNSISDMSMQGWRSRNQMNDAGHAKTINSINEEQTITDPSTGNQIQVQAGSNRYFTNGNNEYIRTDDYLYNPNLDKRVNNYEWKEWKGQ